MTEEKRSRNRSIRDLEPRRNISADKDESETEQSNSGL